MSTSRRTLILALASCLCAARGQQPASQPPLGPANAPAATASITAADLEKHLRVLASDEYGGRLTGTEDQKKAAEYISKHFESLGLEPFGDKTPTGKRGWTYDYDVVMTEVASDSGLYVGDGKRLNANGVWWPLRAKGDAGVDMTVSGKLRLIPKEGKIAKGSLEGTIPVAIIELDTSRDDKLTINEAMMNGMGLEVGKVRAAASKFATGGAQAGIVIFKSYNLPFLVAANMMGVYPGKPIVGDGKSGAAMSDMIQKPRVPVLALGGPDAEAILKQLGLEPKVFDSDPRQKDSTATCRLKLKMSRKPGKATDVVAVLRGSDPSLSAEAVVYSAHMDHVGRAADGSVFNGADDDGSGTVSLLELAEAFAALKPGERPKRSIVFLSVSGEELGLWGSAAYAENPTWPADKLIADINIDMIGRSTTKIPEDTVAVTPTYRHDKYSTIVRSAHTLAKSFGLEFGDGDRFYARSDHYNFAKKGIPVVFFCDDEHADYHLPSDDVDRIEFKKMERIVRMAFLLGLDTANGQSRPETIGRQPSWTNLEGDVTPPAPATESKPVKKER